MLSRDEEINKYLKRVNEYEEKGKLREAIKELEKAVKAKPNEGNLFNRLGDLYIKNDEIEDAVEAFKLGVDAYRKDNFARNAIALCKKILRHDPGNVDIYRTIAELLIELDERSDALMYYSVYAEKQLAQKNEKEVIRTLDHLERIGNLDGKMIKKIHDIYKSLGRDDLAKKFLDQVMVKDVDLEEIKIPEPKAEVRTPVPEKVVIKKEPEELEIEDITNFGHEEVKVEVDTTRLDKVVHEVEAAIAQLRKAMRLDEVIVALDKSVTALSDEQKKAIALLQRSLSSNIDSLQKSVKELHDSSGKNSKDMEVLLKELNRTLSDVGDDQDRLTQKISENLKDVSGSFNTTAQHVISEIKKVMSDYQKSSVDMCKMLGESKDCSVSLTKTTEIMQGTVHKMNECLLTMNDSMTRFILAQEYKDKKQNRFTLVIIAIITIICGFLIVSVFK